MSENTKIQWAETGRSTTEHGYVEIAALRAFILQLCERIYAAHEILARLAEKK